MPPTSKIRFLFHTKNKDVSNINVDFSHLLFKVRKSRRIGIIKLLCCLSFLNYFN